MAACIGSIEYSRTNTTAVGNLSLHRRVTFGCGRSGRTPVEMLGLFTVITASANENAEVPQVHRPGVPQAER